MNKLGELPRVGDTGPSGPHGSSDTRSQPLVERTVPYTHGQGQTNIRCTK